MRTVSAMAATALLQASAATHGAEPPLMKEGLWSIHSQSVTNPGSKAAENTATICRSHAFDQKVRQAQKNMPGCKTVSEELQGNEYSIHTQCTVRGSDIDSLSTVTFKGDSAAHSENHATYKPALDGVEEMTLTQDQKYLGNCPAGAQPGDITRPDGTVIHSGGAH
jgi:hypothetical protein